MFRLDKNLAALTASLLPSIMISNLVSFCLVTNKPTPQQLNENVLKQVQLLLSKNLKELNFSQEGIGNLKEHST